MEKEEEKRSELKSTDYLTEDQLRFCLALLKAEAAEGGYRASVNRFIFQLMALSGLRRCEVVGLELRDLPNVHGKPQIDVREEVAKNERYRAVIVSKEMTEVMDQFCRRFLKGCPPSAPLLRNEYGNRMTGQNVYCRVKTIGRHTGFEWLSPHKLRHTYCSLLYKTNKDQVFVQRQAGHVKPETTGIYTHIGQDEQIAQVQSLSWIAL